MAGWFRQLCALFIVFIGFTLSWMGVEWQSFIQYPLHLPKEGLVFKVMPGTSLKKLSSELAVAGITDKPHFLILLARFKGVTSSLKAGEYVFEYGLTPTRLLQKIVNGEVRQYVVRIGEGWNVYDVLRTVKDNTSLKQTLQQTNRDALMSALGQPGMHPEGQFYPDTYFFPAGTSDLKFLRRAHHMMQSKLKKAWEDRNRSVPLKTPYEALILASIIEKEASLPAERSMIAGVFTRRLKLGMRLQTDPTVIYGLGPGFVGPLTRAQLTQDTPYNTYAHSGLPPTPISMPSFESIQAALHPAYGNDLYFVSKNDGSHYFSATLEEHNKAVAKYQLGEHS
jgi:UPF0755 protein